MTTTQNMYKDKRSASERLGALEAALPSIIGALGKQIDPLTTKISQLTEAVNELRLYTDVLVGLAGTDAVVEKVREVRTAQANEQMASEDADTAKAVESGVLKPADVVTQNSVIVISATGSDGVRQIPDHRRIAFAQVKEEVKDLMLGKAKGDVLTLPDKSTITVVDVYDVDHLALHPPQTQGE